jgi:hypothetical protein
MEFRRREFNGLVSAAALGLGANESLFTGRAKLTISSSGSVAGLNYRGTELVPARAREGYVKVPIGKQSVVCNQPRVIQRDARGVVIEHQFSRPVEMTVRSILDLRDLTGDLTALRHTVRVEFAREPEGHFSLQIPIPTQLPAERRNVFVPMKNGIGRRKRVLGLENDDEYVFRFAGGTQGWRPQQLAIPMVDEWADSTGLHITYCADPYFGSYFRLPYGERAGRLQCTYTRGVTTEPNAVERTLYFVMHGGPFTRAMDAFYATALAEVRPGPEWLHDVAMVGFDYLSENGKGWFADIDALTEAVSPSDRSKVLLALHGWCDFGGRYAFDYRNRRFDRTWVAFSKARDPYVQSFGVTESEDSYRWPKASVEAMQPVPMSLEEMHRRIQYGKKRGFRVAIYFADGTNASMGVKDIYDSSKVLHWGGWQGPDTSGKVYSQNPLHPDVYRFFTTYIRGLLEEYGKEVDGFVWDETFTVRPDAMGQAAAPGYAGVAMMKLVRDCAADVASYNPELAFFASDNIGLNNDVTMAPYCLMAHGTYQDSGFHPEAWPYGLFPNYRNVLWSCNWAPVNRARLTRYGVETFDVPVPISNGAFGDDIGFAEMSPLQRRETMELFNKRKHRPMRIHWIEEAGGEYRYQGRPILYRYSL